MKNIFDGVKFGRPALKNRPVRSATWPGAADDDGNLTETHFETYEALAAGGVGAIVTGITAISPHDALIDGIAQFHSDAFLAQHRRLIDMIHAHGCKVFLQAAIVDSVFEIDGELYRVPISRLTAENISEVVELFKAAGYDGVQLHAAHGFFLSQYLNRDEKILGDLLDVIRSVVSENFCLLAKINGENCIDACKMMAAHGVDAIEISGNYTSREARAHDGEGYFLKYAEAVLERVNVPIILGGGLRSVETMNKILATTDIEPVSLSRALIREPNIVNRWRGGDLRPSTCIGCNGCYRMRGHVCIFNLRRGGRRLLQSMRVQNVRRELRYPHADGVSDS